MTTRRKEDRIRPGQIVCLLDCPVTDEDGEAIRVTGLHRLIEFCPVDRSAGYWEAGWWICPPENDGPDGWLFVDSYTLWQQTDPQSWGHFIAEDRRMELAMEQEEARGEL